MQATKAFIMSDLELNQISDKAIRNRVLELIKGNMLRFDLATGTVKGLDCGEAKSTELRLGDRSARLTVTSAPGSDHISDR
jgi:hypothetical protein